jgi:hypothetical protein
MHEDKQDDVWGKLGQCERVTDDAYARCQKSATMDVDGDLYCDEHAAEEDGQIAPDATTIS